MSKATVSTPINGVDVAEIEELRALVANDPGPAEHEPTAVAHWRGGSSATIEVGDAVLDLGGDGRPNAMQALLASLAACEVDLVAMHAARIGLALEELSVEASGHFDVRAYLHIAGAPDCGYDRIAYRVRLRAPGATRDQIAFLRERCLHSSPVGDSLRRAVPLTVDVQAL